jgi:hypothetical protein
MNSKPCQEPPKGEEVTEKETRIAVAKGIELTLKLREWRICLTHMPSFQNLSR